MARPRGRNLLVALTSLVAIVGCAAGAALLWTHPTLWRGGFDGASVSAVFLFLVGTVDACAAGLAWRLSRTGLVLAMAAGLLLVTWTAFQTVLVRPLGMLEALSLLVGGAVFTLASEVLRNEEASERGRCIDAG
jgi:hypothetical protein